MKLKIIPTLLFNIRAFGLRDGLKLPVYVYGRLKVAHMGRIDIRCPLRRRIIAIGLNSDKTTTTHTLWNNKGTIVVEGPTYINHGCVLLNEGTLIFRGNALIGLDTVFDIKQSLELGHDCSIGYRSHFTDTDSHYTVDLATRRISNNTRGIRIGNYNWFGACTFVKKGTVTPDYLLTASPNTLLCKDYSSLPPHSVLAGSPARPIKEGIRRIYNFFNEHQIRQHFKNHPDQDFTIDSQLNLDSYCRLI
ncbi:MAG: hypothetical protein K5778_02680 [Bacteroidaceae bacterium]|nr:hypothetical protein [Bacteroidaceae bacterium]